MPTLTIPPSRNLNRSPRGPMENNGLPSGKRKTFKLVAKHNLSPEMEVYRNGIVLGSWQFFQPPVLEEDTSKSFILLEDHINSLLFFFDKLTFPRYFRVI